MPIRDYHSNYDEKIIALKEEGCDFAELGDFRKALNSWQRALQILISIPADTGHAIIRSILHELKAQSYLELDMIMNALQGYFCL